MSSFKKISKIDIFRVIDGGIKKWFNEDVMLTQTDYDEVEELVRKVVKEETSHLPSKDEFYEANDKLMGELKAIRENTEVGNSIIARHSDEIEKLQKIHPKYSHASV